MPREDTVNVNQMTLQEVQSNFYGTQHHLKRLSSTTNRQEGFKEHSITPEV